MTPRAHLAVEAGVSFGWDKYADDVVAIDRFGASADYARIYQEYGITATAVAVTLSAPNSTRRIRLSIISALPSANAPAVAHERDDAACDTLARLFPGRRIAPIPCTDLVQGLGAEATRRADEATARAAQLEDSAKRRESKLAPAS